MKTFSSRVVGYFLRYNIILLSSLIYTSVFLPLNKAASQINLNPENLNGIVIEDIFGRSIKNSNIILVDWEGFIANPAIKLYVKPPVNASFPGTLIISSSEPRIFLIDQARLVQMDQRKRLSLGFIQLWIFSSPSFLIVIQRMKLIN